jgi:hypothetical protein
MWAYAREGSAKEQMRACFENNTRRNDYAQQLQQRFSRQTMYDRFVNLIVDKEELEAFNKEIDDLLDDLV